MIIKIILLAVATYLFFDYRNRKNTEKLNRDTPSALEEIPYHQTITADKPIPFGYKTAWLAIKTMDSDLIIQALNLKELREESWERGLNAAYTDWSHTVFVTPPIDGWTLVVGFALGTFNEDEENNNRFVDFLNILATKIPHFYYFATYRVDDYHAWVSIRNGAITRAYAVFQDETIVNIGEKTIEEQDLGFNFFDTNSDEAKKEDYYEQENLRFPDEEDVINISGAWSINPLEIGERLQTQLFGIVGKLR